MNKTEMRLIGKKIAAERLLTSMGLGKTSPEAVKVNPATAIKPVAESKPVEPAPVEVIPAEPAAEPIAAEPASPKKAVGTTIKGLRMKLKERRHAAEPVAEAEAVSEETIVAEVSSESEAESSFVAVEETAVVAEAEVVESVVESEPSSTVVDEKVVVEAKPKAAKKKGFKKGKTIMNAIGPLGNLE